MLPYDEQRNTRTVVHLHRTKYATFQNQGPMNDKNETSPVTSVAFWLAEWAIAANIGAMSQ